MATTTEKGFPYPEPVDPDKPRVDIEELAKKIDTMPGIASMSTAEVLNLTELWPGQLVFSTTSGMLFVNTDGTASGWVVVLDNKVPIPIIYGGTGLKVAPQLLVSLSSTAADSPLKQQPRPGVTGVLPIGNGGTGAATPEAARTNLGVPSTAEVGDVETNFVAIFESAMNA